MHRRAAARAVGIFRGIVTPIRGRLAESAPRGWRDARRHVGVHIPSPSARVAAGARDAAGDPFAAAPGHALRSPRRALCAPQQPTPAAPRSRSEANPWSRSCPGLKPIRGRLWNIAAELIQLITEFTTLRSAEQYRGHTGATSLGRPASCDADKRITPSLIGGQRNALCSNRFHSSTSPVPGQDLQTIGSLSTEDENCSPKGIIVELPSDTTVPTTAREAQYSRYLSGSRHGRATHKKAAPRRARTELSRWSQEPKKGS
ncbi:hypothetical protein FBZ93_1304 [Bradyrhizobium macuxiense]|uniref:Uncharacterized protein n=1 Tax=Bradyrhizobium macuxiense TaxID=1755647 RepID=A0A560KS04_9BRAD|nr:hypothetical protein FBZ93_1304 [Bradyrhizobium macuxiense]